MLTTYRRLTWAIVFSLCLILTLKSEVKAQPYTLITLTMYHLDNFGGKVNTCVPGPFEIRFGCTNNSSKPYPFSATEITIGMEGHLVNGKQQGYLHNVTPTEIALSVSSQGNKPLASVKAQAIAARTFAFYHISLGANIDNAATSYQVYVPFRYDDAPNAQKQRVDEAVSEILYLVTPTTLDPILAHFGADNDEYTTQGAASYLKRIYDPISALIGSDVGTSHGGMSSNGASRWGFGHESNRGPVSPDNSNYPGDNKGDGNFWSVHWDEAFQILTHYYTGIQIVNANSDFLLPSYRWNPLTVD